MISEKIDIALLQDAYCNKTGTLSGIPSNWAVFPSKSLIAHLVIQNTDMNYSHLNTVAHCPVVIISVKDVHLIFGLIYSAPKSDFE